MEPLQKSYQTLVDTYNKYPLLHNLREMQAGKYRHLDDAECGTIEGYLVLRFKALSEYLEKSNSKNLELFNNLAKKITKYNKNIPKNSALENLAMDLTSVLSLKIFAYAYVNNYGDAAKNLCYMYEIVESEIQKNKYYPEFPILVGNLAFMYQKVLKEFIKSNMHFFEKTSLEVLTPKEDYIKTIVNHMKFGRSTLTSLQKRSLSKMIEKALPEECRIYQKTWEMLVNVRQKLQKISIFAATIHLSRLALLYYIHYEFTLETKLEEVPLLFRGAYTQIRKAKKNLLESIQLSGSDKRVCRPIIHNLLNAHTGIIKVHDKVTLSIIDMVEKLQTVCYTCMSQIVSTVLNLPELENGVTDLKPQKPITTE